MSFPSFFFSCCLAAVACCQAAHLSVTQPFGETLDREVRIEVKKAPPFETVELQAFTEDNKGEIWSSRAIFYADRMGRVDLASSEPLFNSSYQRIDPMGLFWSMLPPSGDETVSFHPKSDSLSVDLKMYVAGKLKGQETIVRHLRAPDVKKIDVREKGLVATLFLPESKKPLPVVVTLAGADGGLGETRGKLLASNGFAVLSLGYFGVEGLPSNLQDIPLEYFETAFAWLKEQTSVDSSRIGIYGNSRGGELSLLLGSHFPDAAQAIVAAVPSSVTYAGLSETPVCAWLYRNEPVQAFAPMPKLDLQGGKGTSPTTPLHIRDGFVAGMDEKNSFTSATILVEKIRCPLLLISAGDDHVWPSDLYVQQIIGRLSAMCSPISCTHLHYPHAGHGIYIPNFPVSGPTSYHPIGKLWFSMGGSRAADAAASADSWREICAFFHKNLK